MTQFILPTNKREQYLQHMANHGIGDCETATFLLYSHSKGLESEFGVFHGRLTFEIAEGDMHMLKKKDGMVSVEKHFVVLATSSRVKSSGESSIVKTLLDAGRFRDGKIELRDISDSPEHKCAYRDNDVIYSYSAIFSDLKQQQRQWVKSRLNMGKPSNECSVFHKWVEDDSFTITYSPSEKAGYFKLKVRHGKVTLRQHTRSEDDKIVTLLEKCFPSEEKELLVRLLHVDSTSFADTLWKKYQDQFE